MTEVSFHLSKLQFPAAAHPQQEQQQRQRQFNAGATVSPNLDVICRGEVFIPAGTRAAELETLFGRRP